MNNLKYNYALDQFNNCIAIDDAIKGNEYFLGKTDIPLIVRDGEFNQKHFSLKSKSDSLLKSYVNESPEHYNEKYKILKQGYFDFEGMRITPKKIEIEYRFKETNQVCDVVFFDENDDLMCIIEIFVTNRKEKKDIDKFKKLNINVYEYNYNNRETELINWSFHNEKIKLQAERNIEKWYEQKTNEKIQRIERDRDTLIELLSSQDTGKVENKLELVGIQQGNIDREQRETYSISEKFNSIRTKIEITKREKQSSTFEITRKEGELNDIEQKINWTEKTIKETIKKTGSESSRKIRIEQAASELAKYKGLISWQENRSRQANTVIKRNK